MRVKVVDVNSHPWKEILDNYNTKNRVYLAFWIYSNYFWKQCLPDMRFVRYFQVPVDYENNEIVAYMCGLLSACTYNEIDIVDNEEHFFPAQMWDLYEVGKRGEKLGCQAFDMFTSPLRRYLKKRNKRLQKQIDQKIKESTKEKRRSSGGSAASL